MKKILIIVIWILSMCCAFFAGGWTNQFAKDQYTMQDIASMMTTSFGWTIQSSKDVMHIRYPYKILVKCTTT